MAITVDKAEVTSAQPTPVPPLRPDPRIIGNFERNQKVLQSDRQAARDELKRSENARGGDDVSAAV